MGLIEQICQWKNTENRALFFIFSKYQLGKAGFQFKYTIILLLVQYLLQDMQCNFVWQEDQTKQKGKRRKYRDNSYTLTYPSDKIKDIKFQSSEEISTFLLRNALEIGYCKWQLFEKIIVDKGDYIKIVYSCRKQYCDAELVYHQKKIDKDKEGKPELQMNGLPKKYYLAQAKINNQHRHVLKLTPKIANQQNIRQYLFDLPVEEKFQNHVQVIKQKFNLTKCQAKYLKDRVFWRFKDEDHMLRKLTQRKVTFRRKIEDGDTIILMLLSETMKKNYKKFGDILCFDITYKLLKKKRGETRHLGVGFFVGQDQNSRIVLFAVSTIKHQTSDNFYLLFDYFFQCLESVPETILTDDQRALGYAIERLRVTKGYEYVHLLDWFHKMQSIRRNTKREPFRDEIFTLFCRVMKEPSKMVYQDMIYQIATMLQREDLMKQFLRDKERYCLCQAPPKFFAFGIASTRAEAFNSLIKRSVPHQTNIGRLIYFVLRVQKRLINRMSVLNYMNEDLIKNIMDPQIQMLSFKLEHLALEQIRQYYEESRDFASVDPGKNELFKYIPFVKYERDYKFQLMYDVKYNCWRCQCKNNFRTGMPCAHLVKVVRYYGGCISYYINERWYHDKEDVAVKKASRPNVRVKRI